KRKRAWGEIEPPVFFFKQKTAYEMLAQGRCPQARTREAPGDPHDSRESDPEAGEGARERYEDLGRKIQAALGGGPQTGSATTRRSSRRRSLAFGGDYRR